MQSLNGTLSRIIDTRFRLMQNEGLKEKRSLASISPEKTLALTKRIEDIIKSKVELNSVISSHTSTKVKTCSRSIEAI